MDSQNLVGELSIYVLSGVGLIMSGIGSYLATKVPALINLVRRQQSMENDMTTLKENISYFQSQLNKMTEFVTRNKEQIEADQRSHEKKVEDKLARIEDQISENDKIIRRDIQALGLRMDEQHQKISDQFNNLQGNLVASLIDALKGSNF